MDVCPNCGHEEVPIAAAPPEVYQGWGGWAVGFWPVDAYKRWFKYFDTEAEARAFAQTVKVEGQEDSVD
jgi:hypothetical protein